MTLSEAVQPITADDDTIREALEHADLPSLMCALVHITGDMESLRGDIRPVMEFLGGGEHGLTEEQRSRVRAHALEVLRSYRDQPTQAIVPSDGQVREMLQFLLGQEVSEDYVEFLISELSMSGEDPYAQPALFETPPEARADFRVLVIGAGMSGLLSAIRLQQAGVAFEVIEKNADVGGTWYENTYPGCRVDSANHVYSYSFRPEDWPQHFSERKVLHSYFSDVADEYSLREHIRFNTEVESARFDVASGLWTVATIGPGAERNTVTANAVISAVGQLNRPNIPEIAGRADFRGPQFHSARWQHDVDLRGKRVGVIGSGASAFQFVPIIAQEAAEVTIFQRTAPWVLPNADYFQHVPAGAHWLLNHVPFYAKWFRFAMFWRAAEGLLGAVTAEDDWQSEGPAVSAANENLRQGLMANLQAMLGDDPELLAKCTPDYPPGAKRALIDDGAWFNALKRDNVHLITDPIDQIAAGGVNTTAGQHEFDVLIFATGFTASDFLMPMQIYGADGVELHDVWAGEPRAYKGITVPGFPNLFCCYGPNTNIVVNSSIVFFSECEVRYILGCLALLIGERKQMLEVRSDIHDAYNERIDEGNRNMAWGRSTVSTWYKNASGRITQNWPFTLLKFWQQTRSPNKADYLLK